MAHHRRDAQPRPRPGAALIRHVNRLFGFDTLERETAEGRAGNSAFRRELESAAGRLDRYVGDPAAAAPGKAIFHRLAVEIGWR